MNDKLNGFGSLLRFITPVLVGINLWIVGQLSTQISDLNIKMYGHATNAELHIPRSELARIEVRLESMQKELLATIRHEQR